MPLPRLIEDAAVAELLDYPSCIAAVEAAFRALGEKRVEPPAVCGVHVPAGGFHIKAGMLDMGRPYFAAKTNANFPANPAAGLPTIQGVVLLFDAAAGRPLAIMESGELTVRRTAAATAVAARWLARPDAAVATICGCGVQGRAQLEALTHVLPLRKAYAFDLDGRAARRFADRASRSLGLDVEPASDLGRSARASDVCVTCTPARAWLLGPDDVGPGTFVAGVGADSEAKWELAPALLSGSRVVVDVLEQCARFGDLHHALEAGALAVADVHAELGEVVAGVKPGRSTPEQVTVFDSTGMALQDVAAAALVYERAVAAGDAAGDAGGA